MLSALPVRYKFRTMWKVPHRRVRRAAALSIFILLSNQSAPHITQGAQGEVRHQMLHTSFTARQKFTANNSGVNGCLLLLLAALALSAMPIRAQDKGAQGSVQSTESKAKPDSAGKSETATTARVTGESPFEFSVDPAMILRHARSIYVRQQSIYFKPEELENVLRRRREIQQWQLRITRDEASADLIIEVRRKAFTTKFVFVVLDPRTQTIVGSGRVSSLFGDLESKIASSFVKQLARVRPLPVSP